MTRNKIWVIDDDRAMRWVLEKTFKEEGFDVTSFEEAQSALDLLLTNQPDVILTDIRMPGMDGLNFLSRVKSSYPELPVIIMTAHSDLESAVSSYQTGAFEYLPKPFDIDEALALVNRAILHITKLQQQENTKTSIALPSTEIIGESPAMQEVFRAIGRLSQSHITVLINGESGTGKELVAHALHRHSPRSNKPFIALNMAAIPKDLIETELFGHEKGAFTGANTQRQGRFEQANGGTLFLDEIGDMPFETQTRLLRVLADGEFYRVGGHIPVKVNVRIVAATHQDLEKLVHAGKFREDLYHRLNVIRIHIPKLAHRNEDIPMLAQHFLAQAAKELAVSPKILKSETVTYLQQLPWPGNVRQLENTCRWLTVMITGRDIYPDDLPSELKQIPIEEKTSTITPAISAISHNTTSTTPNSTAHFTVSAWDELLEQWAVEKLQNGEMKILDIATPMFERTLIQAALAQTKGRKRHAAELLGWGRNTLTRKLKELGMDSTDDDEE
ncbi:nitrogen regulation protein NR(I) [Acinetobacter qingfengensis]|uniref:DNA-binding transcriptional regulator NtrC n=1 Tax=Acinetobacter qingfengensis TaxID=1262585 RepID=A0A1E7RE79_9GAMM|nr:nitrogen regulation protein NR(I) [Acinetobacter qingfengensis]KAA8734395.1 nitrogen regulation protein NR(I) [Acinetobacter qingfengensis]OEY97596.1 nitrogen regulation protein NR(I) [Acinetobacter qingfengensis]